jgi:hypothetical protein
VSGKKKSQDEIVNVDKLVTDLRSFLSDLESEGYAKESLVILLTKFEVAFLGHCTNMPAPLKTAIEGFIQHGFEYAENKVTQSPLIHDLEKIEKAIKQLKKEQEGEA